MGKEQFYAKTIPLPETGCLLWVGCWSVTGGYGLVGWSGRQWKAHRFAIMLEGIAIPKGMHVCHKCDTPPCVNINHLFIGTPRENVADSFNKNRRPIRESSPNAKLTTEQVLQIRSSNEFGRVLANQYGISQSLASKIKRRTTWKSI
jgi:hypothetical protein